MKSINKLGLGTVQWGLAYGLTNQHGKTSSETVTSILDAAQRRGLRILDTASLYGEAEAVLGANNLQAFRVVTKTPKFGTSAITGIQADELTRIFHQSLERLALERTFGLLTHHVQDLLVPGGEKLVFAMQDLKEKRLVEKIGVSVYDGMQIDAVLKVFTPDLVQLPLSVLDQRLIQGGYLERLKQAGVEVHVRSVFLQGLLLMPLHQLPANFEPIRPLLTRWHAAAAEQGMSAAQAALSYARDLPYVDTVLVGVESLAQFNACADDFCVDKRFNARGLSCDDPAFVNPALWRIS